MSPSLTQGYPQSHINHSLSTDFNQPLITRITVRGGVATSRRLLQRRLRKSESPKSNATISVQIVFRFIIIIVPAESELCREQHEIAKPTVPSRSKSGFANAIAVKTTGSRFPTDATTMFVPGWLRESGSSLRARLRRSYLWLADSVRRRGNDEGDRGAGIRVPILILQGYDIRLFYRRPGRSFLLKPGDLLQQMGPR